MPDADAPLYLDSLVAVDPKTGRPAGRFGNGAEIELRWRSNGRRFVVYAGRDDKPAWEHEGEASGCRVAGRGDTTTFVVEAGLVTGDAEPGPEGSEESTRYASITVLIDDPDIVAGSVTAGTLTAQHTRLDDEAIMAAATAHTLTVEGTSTFRASVEAASLDCTGAATVRGLTTLADAQVAGVLESTGEARLGAVSADTLAIRQMLKALRHRVVDAGAYAVDSDGFLVGLVDGGSDVWKKCVARIWAWTDVGITSQATGGNFCSWRSGKDYTMTGNYGSFVLPVPQGATLRFRVDNAPDNEIDPRADFFWVSFGDAPLRPVDANAADALAPPPLETHDGTWRPDPADVEAVVDLLTGGRNDVVPGAREQLASAVARLAGVRPDGP